MNFLEFTKRFPTEEDAIDFIVATKYKGGYICPNCGCVHKCIYHHISVKHLQKYVNEFCFRLNYRECNEAFDKLINLSVL